MAPEDGRSETSRGRLDVLRFFAFATRTASLNVARLSMLAGGLPTLRDAELWRPAWPASATGARDRERASGDTARGESR